MSATVLELEGVGVVLVVKMFLVQEHQLQTVLLVVV
jgi:hypothetical protein